MPSTSETLGAWLSSVWSPVSASVGAVLGAIATHLWRRFRARMVVLRCQVIHAPVANAPGMIGHELEVKYLGVVAPNLFQCNVTLENDSNTDLTGVVLNMAYKDGTVFVSGGGAIEGSNQFLPLTQAFMDASARLTALPEKDRVQSVDWQYTSSRRDFVIPVLNRMARATFFFTVHGLSASLPKLSVTTDHVGVRLVDQPPRQLFWGVPNDRGALLGFLTGVVLLIVLPRLLVASWTLSWVLFLFGALALPLGALMIKGWRLLVRVMS